MHQKSQRCPWRAPIILLLSLPCSFLQAGVLQDYVYRADPAYRYQLALTQPGKGYILTMVSQQWRTLDEVNRAEWNHRIHLAVPDSPSSSTALLYIEGGDNNDSFPQGLDSTITLLAEATNTIVAMVEMVPNQPLRFTDETRSRSEDAIIAYSWDKYMTTEDPEWIAQLPMTKAAVRAMDTVQHFLAQPAQGGLLIDSFFVTGASKRGWTAWLTAAIDNRVIGVAPLVIDMLNTQKSFRHHHAVYGFFAPAVHDYQEMGIFSKLNSPEAEQLLTIVDPLSYVDCLTMPKILIHSAGDQFFLPDSSRFYYDRLPGVKRLRYVPNTSHSLNTGVVYSLMALYMAMINNTPLPAYTWQTVDENTIRVETPDSPSQVLLWTITNPAARDFRLETLGPAWKSTPLPPETDGSYIATVPTPLQGYSAFFIELSFPSPYVFPYTFTTGIQVVPDYLPYACDFNFDSLVDTEDVNTFAGQWLLDEPGFVDIFPTAAGDGAVDLLDLSILSRNYSPQP